LGFVSAAQGDKMELISLFKESSAFFLTVVGLFSLLVGSFLNAAIYRIPIMLQRGWREECEELFGGDVDNIDHPSGKEFNLFIPRSQCPTCGHMITALENIPVISYLFLGGKCSSCKTRISIQYPIIEIFTALLSVFVAWKIGVGWETLAALVFTWTLITMSLIDAKTMLLPDNLTLPLMWLGIAVNYQEFFVTLESSVLGAIIGYMSLWSLFHVFKLITGKDGMGYGDFKLLSALGAWVGFSYLPQIILISSVVGSIAGISMLIFGKTKQQQPIPFGPYLAVAGWIALLWGEQINTSYLAFLH
jgi:leader peptidase (prepilin peptidase)/N-methyltransferase